MIMNRLGFSIPLPTFSGGAVSIFLFFFSFSAAAQCGCTDCRCTDSLELVALYNSTNGANWTNKWVLTQPMTTWYRVTLDANGRVIQLYTSFNGLNGTIPNLNLPKLQRLSLFNNQLSGNIPDFNLPELQELWLYQNQLNGTISNFNNLPKLKQLYLYNNQLTGNIPNFNIATLEKVGLYNNQLNGSVPSFSLPNLQELSLFGNSLTGNVPNFNLPNLTSLNISNNQLTGNIPNLNLPVLRYLSLSNNQLSGSIPPFNLPNLQNLFLFSNQLSGCIPREIKINCVSLMATFSNISSNPGLATQNWANYWNNGEGACVACSSLIASISGNSTICGTRSTTLTATTNAVLPTYLWSTGATTSSISVTAAATYDVTVTQSDGCTKTASFTLSNDNSCRCTDSLALIDLYNSTNGANWTNKWTLSQPMTTWYGVTLNGSGCVTCIDLDGNNACSAPSGTGNNLVGTLPSSLNDLQSLTALYLSSNQLSGSIPNFNLPNLKILWLYDNRLSGNIPNFNLADLQVLALHRNWLSGNIPNFNLPNLQELYLFDNNGSLSGSIPNFNLPNLKILNLEGNGLSGNIPSLNLSNLVFLSLRSNRLTGCIPISIKVNCPLIGSTGGNISFNSNLATQSWANYWNNGEGACVACASVTASISGNNTICGTRATTLTATTNAVLPTYLWSTGATTSSISVTAAATYDVTVTQSDGCTKTASFTLSNDNSCRCTDSLALIDLYNSTNGANWTNKWTLSQPMTTWYGVTLNGSGCVTCIDMDGNANCSGFGGGGSGLGNNLSGTLPNSLSNMQNLIGLFLNSNGLSGAIPSLTTPNLKDLWLGANPFTGAIPNFNLPKLETLWFNNNTSITGPLPDFNLPNLKNLVIFSLPSLTGTIPNFNLLNLENLSIYSSPLSGNIPNYNLPKLKQLNHSQNSHTGSLPNFNLPSLETLSVFGNQLSGSIPSLNLSNLKYLYLNNNQFSGCIPSVIKLNCSLIGASNGNITDNTNLATQSWANYWNNGEGACLPCASVSASITGTTTICGGGSTTLTATTNAVSPTYAWSTGVNTASINVTTTGNYAVTVTQNTCSGITSSTIVTNGTIATPSVDPPTQPTCSTPTGSVMLTGLPSSGNWTITRTGGATTTGSGTSATISGLSAGNYTFTVTNASGCTSPASGSVTINTAPSVPTAPTAGAPTQPTCTTPTGSVTLSGLPSGSWTINPGGITGNTSTRTITGLAQGTYNFTVTNASGCTSPASGSVTINAAPSAPTAPTAGTPTQPTCTTPTGSVTLSGLPSGNWTINPGGITGNTSTRTITGLAQGTYTYTVTNASGCTSSASGSVTINAAPSVPVAPTAGTPTQPTCTTPTGSVTLSGLPSGNWTINPGGITGNTSTRTITGLAQGTYNFTVTNAPGCTSPASSSVIINAAPIPPTTPSISSSQPAVCIDETVQLTANGSLNSATDWYWYTGSCGETFIGTGTSIDITQTATTTYYVRAEGGGCPNSDCGFGTIIFKTSPSADISGTLSFCSGSSTTLTASGGSTYQWTGGSTNNPLTVSSAGTYFVTVTGSNGCTATTSANVTQITTSPPPTTTVTYCQNATAAPLSTTGTNLLWYANQTGGTGNATAPTPSTTTVGTVNYYVTQTANGCESSRTAIPVTVKAAPSAPTASNRAYCQNVTASPLSASGSSLLWYGTNATGGTGSSTAPIPSTTTVGTATYYVSQTVNGCESPRKAITVTINPLPSMATPSVTDVKCRGNSDGIVNVSASGGTEPIDFSISPFAGSQSLGTFTDLPIGNYTFTATDANSCTATQSVTIGQPATVVSFSTPSVKAVKCNGGNDGEITLSASGGTGTITITTNPTITPTSPGLYQNLAARTYIFTATDANNCTTTTTATVTEPAALNMSAGAVTNILCNGSSTGQIPVTISGGTANYQIDYQKGSGAITSLPSSAATTQTITGLSAGTYNITVTDANGCKKVIATTLTEPSSAVVATQTAITQAACQGGTTGAVTLSATGGVSPYTFTRSAGISNTTGNFTGLSAGSFVVTISDANGCSSTKSVTITEPSALVASISLPKNVTCPNGMDGGFQINASGGTPLAGNQYNFSYGLSSGGSTSLGASTSPQSTGNILAAGTYSVTVTDGNSCTSNIFTQTITQPSAFAFSSKTITPTACSSSTGSANFTVSGGSGTYTSIVLKNGVGTVLSTTGSSASRSATNLSSGNYTVEVTDDKSCKANLSFVVNSTTSNVVLSTPSVTDVKCKGGNTGSVSVTATNAVSFAISSRAGQQTSGTFNGLTAGRYTITAFDNNGCTDFKDTTVNEPATVVAFSNPTITDVKCKNGNDGKVILSVSGGTGSIMYAMQAPTVGTQNGNTFSNLTASTYIFTATDANGCTATTTAIVKEPNIGLSFSPPSVTDVKCKNGNDGKVVLFANGGTLPIVFSASPNNGTQSLSGTFDNLTASVYTFTATDNNSCTATTTATVSEPSTAVNLATPSVINVKCNGGNTGQMTAIANGGTGSISFETNPILTPSTGTLSGIFTGVPAQTYTVIAKDANGCKSSKDVIVTQPAPLSATVGTITNIACTGDSTGQIPLTISGGTPSYRIDYQKNGGATKSVTGVSTLTGLAAGTYSITLTDANNCTATAIANQTVTQSPPFSFNIVSKTDANCGVNNGAISFRINGSSNNYTSTVVKLGTTIIQNYGVGTNTTQRDLTDLAGGTYSVLVKDNNNCTDSLTFTIAARSSIAIASATPVATTCFDKTDGKITILASGGTGTLSYSIDGTTFLPNNIFSNLAANNYTVTVKDGDGCTANQAVTVSKPPAIVFSTPSVSNVKCRDGNDGQIVLSASGGIGGVTLTMNPIIGIRSVDTFKNLTANTYIFTAKDGNNCAITQSLTVSQPNAALVLANPSLTNIKCFGGVDGQITASTTGGTGQIKYSISSATINQQNTVGVFSNLTAQNYTVTALDSNGCSDSKPAIITSPNKLTNSFTTSYSTICTQGSGNGKVNTSITGGTSPYKYSWSNGATTDSIVNLAVGNYIVTIMDNNNCTAIDSAKITCVPITYTLTFSTDSTRCFGDSTGVLHFSPSGNNQTATNGAPYTYVWQSATNPNLRGSGSILTNGGTVTVPNLPAGKYDVTITDALNVLPKTASITIYSLPRLSLGNPTIAHPKCYGDQNGSLQFSNITGGTSPYRFVWSNGATTPSVSNLAAGTYRISVMDNNNCQDIASVTLRTDPISIGSKNTTAASCMGVANGSVAVLNVSGGTPTNGNYTFHWANNTTNTGVSGTLPNLAIGSYRFTVSDANNCQKVDSFQITALRTLQLSATVNNITCYGLRNGRISATVSAIGTPKSPYTFTWSGSVNTPTNAGNTTTVNALTAGNYLLSIKDGDGCRLDSTFTVIQPTDIQLGATSIKNETCTVGKDGQITPTVSGGQSLYTYRWSNNTTNAIATNLSEGPYILTVTDAGGCTKSKEFMVGYTADEYAKPMASAIDIKSHSITFNWTVVPNVIGYRIKVDTNNRSIGWQTVNSTVLSHTVDSLKEKQNVKFAVQAIGRNGCNARIDSLVAQTVEENANIECLIKLKENIPNAISVNGDSTNEIFEPLEYLIISQCSRIIRTRAERLLIVNQWGEIIYETTEKDPHGNCACRWHGNSKRHHKPVPEGAYFYVLVFNIEGKQHQVRGTINVFTNQ